ncbi:helix-turn-helix domain-containing protein [Aerophototrophica crusticola]|uniref:Helix-turn-helix domain-containing protein n=2 Tax=Aerophototrophica crusticola TaxID=1709002 RepID=A0A858RD76_9PROT|nr:helix-turn-helix domain-containing protein [Rhodospirillaceae bacterium B3]
MEATTEEDIQRHIVEDGGIDLGELDEAEFRVVRAYPDPRSLRRKLGMTQEEFASTFGLNLYTLRDWEQGRAQPEGTARTLLRVIEHAPETVRQALAA